MRDVGCRVCVQVTAKEDGNAHFDAFQVSKQCMEMVAEGALEVGEVKTRATGETNAPKEVLRLTVQVLKGKGAKPNLRVCTAKIEGTLVCSLALYHATRGDRKTNEVRLVRIS